MGLIRRHRRERRTGGQSLAEFALMLPFLMTLLLVGADFGRVFLGWVQLNNAVRVAATFAAENPTAWGSPGDPATVDEYTLEVNNDVSPIDCTLPAVPSPTFPAGTSVGMPAQVSITCRFSLITPFLGNIMGSPINVTASAAFPIRAGSIDGIPISSIAPTPSPSPSPTPAPTGSAGPTPTPTATSGASPSPTPTPMCTVPDFTTGVWTYNATDIWHGAGFALPIIFNPLVPPDYQIHHQNPNKGQSKPCDSTVMTVRP